MDERYYMRKALQLARKGRGNVSPNPLVGAVLVKDDRIISSGFHACFGEAHAESVALDRIPPDASAGSTLYVTMEPCNHHGKTPPCTEQIVSSGVDRVVIGMIDPNPLVNGQGISRLKASGITVEEGFLENECRELNRGYISHITRKRPYVTLKIAQTLDGRIATSNGNSHWITGDKSRKEAHRLRAENDAILVGINTLIEDDCLLTTRMVRGGNPKRIVLDSALRFPPDAAMLADSEAPVIVATGSETNQESRKKLSEKGVTLWPMAKSENGRLPLSDVMKHCYNDGITSLLVEGGQQVITSFLRSRFWDRLIISIAPRVFGSGIDAVGDLGISLPEEAVTFSSFSWKKLGVDMMFEGRR